MGRTTFRYTRTQVRGTLASVAMLGLWVLAVSGYCGGLLTRGAVAEAAGTWVVLGLPPLGLATAAAGAALGRTVVDDEGIAAGNLWRRARCSWSEVAGMDLTGGFGAGNSVTRIRVRRLTGGAFTLPVPFSSADLARDPDFQVKQACIWRRWEAARDRALGRQRRAGRQRLNGRDPPGG